jgi:CRISPR/Cas system CMR subunit Cmr4 (Cas7 group RAMP superfamily)
MRWKRQNEKKKRKGKWSEEFIPSTSKTLNVNKRETDAKRFTSKY